MKNLLRSIKSLGPVEGLKVYTSLKNKRIDKIKLSHAAADISIRGGTSDVAAFKKVFFRKEYDIEPASYPEVIIDAGANVGFSSIFFALKYDRAKVISIEPDKENYKLLANNAFFYRNIRCLNTVLWNKAALVELRNGRTDHGGFIVEEALLKTKDTFSSVCINDLMKQYEFKQIDILKLDIEGAEKELFSSNYQYWLPRTKIIIIELHDHLQKDCSTTFYDTLSQFKFETYTKGGSIVAINKNPI
jgi:FkbM family methyltransferase